MRITTLGLASILLAACGGAAADDTGTAPDAAGPAVDAAGPTVDAASCEAPDMLIVLDRTMSMHKTPDGQVPANTPAGHAKSKWSLAIGAVEALTGALDGTIRFGLELFPRNPGGGKCVTLSEKIAGQTATNATCQGGEVPVAPEPATGAAIDATLDPETTELCTSTPIGEGLGTAAAELASLADPVRA